MHNVLSLIVETRKNKIEILRKNREELLTFMKQAPKPVPFKEAIKREGKLSIIAEIKQASPSAGVLRKDFSAVAIAKIYEQCKVQAISVLTEEEFFLGKVSYIQDIKKEVQLPILRKDFILDEIQVYESRAVGADAILLIVKILEAGQLAKLYALSRDLGMDVLVEIHTEKELRKALKLGADMIGINNRNLNTLKVDVECTKKLTPFIPADIVRVSESGIKSLKDVLWLKGLSIDAALVGETLMKADNIADKLKELNIDTDD
jgi:indole-3-glycerol phosphate synthase